MELPSDSYKTRWPGVQVRLAMYVKRQAVSGAKLDCVEGSIQLWMEVLRQCFVGGPVTSITCIGVTLGHLML